MPRPFRFIAPMPRLSQTPAQWHDAIRRIEDLGFSTVSVSEHLTGGWVMEPTAAMLAAAEATRHLRMLSLVLANDFRHPALLHKTLATIDLLSEGRLEIGLGTGWLEADYTAAGLRLDPPAVRIARLAESVKVLKGLFGPEPFSFEGRHYTIRGLEGLPKPVQAPHPPLLIGGGGPRLLDLAAREADIVGIHCRLAGRLSATAARDLAAPRVADKVSRVRAAAIRAGRSFEALELQFSVYLCRITDSPSSGDAAVSSFAGLLEAEPELVSKSPAVLIGPLEKCVDLLVERRERFGLSYLNLGSDVEAVAPLVARLAGT